MESSDHSRGLSAVAPVLQQDGHGHAQGASLDTYYYDTPIDDDDSPAPSPFFWLEDARWRSRADSDPDRVLESTPAGNVGISFMRLEGRWDTGDDANFEKGCESPDGSAQSAHDNDHKAHNGGSRVSSVGSTISLADSGYASASSAGRVSSVCSAASHYDNSASLLSLDSSTTANDHHRLIEEQLLAYDVINEQIIAYETAVAQSSMTYSETLKPFPLHQLPDELMTAILMEIPDLQTLRSLVLASPDMCRVYLDQRARRRILLACLQRELDGYFVDAYACVMSHACRFGSAREESYVSEYCSDYNIWRTIPETQPDPEFFSLHRIQQMAKFHAGVVRPVANAYSEWALKNLKALSKVAPECCCDLSPVRSVPKTRPELRTQSDPVLSRTEEIRVCRAVYRWETHSHLFGYDKEDLTGQYEGNFPLAEDYLALFSPWDIEAIDSIDLFLREKYAGIFEMMRDNAQDSFIPSLRAKGENVSNMGQHQTPETEDVKNNKLLTYAIGLVSRLDRELNGSYRDRCCAAHPRGVDRLPSRYIDGQLERGLELLVPILDIDNIHKLHVAMQNRINFRPRAKPSLPSLVLIFRDCMTLTRQLRDVDEQTRCIERTDAMVAQDPLEFSGDSVPADNPPIAWVLLWDRRYSAVWGDFIPKTLRRSGFVMWDNERLENLDSKNLITEQWKLTNGETLGILKSRYGWNVLNFDSDECRG